MTKVLILGSTGMLGQALIKAAKKRNLDVYGMAIEKADFCFDITDDLKLKKLILDLKPEVVINTVAIVSIEKCEENPSKAYMINARPVSIIVRLCDDINAYFVQVSTDHYFTGDKDKRHTENDPIKLVNEYARTKYTAEKFALTYSNSLVLRTNIVGFRGDHANPTFIEWVLDSLNKSSQMKLFSDFFTSSIDVKTFAEILFDKILKIRPTDLLNFASSEVFSKKDFITYFATQLEFDITKQSTNSSVFDLKKVPRAESLGLDVTRCEGVLADKLPTMKMVVDNLIAEYKEKIL